MMTTRKPTTTRNLPAAAVLLLGLTACATQIHNRDETITPPSKKLGSFQAVAIKPLAIEKMEGDPSDQAAAKRIETELQTCMAQIFPSLQTGQAPAGAAKLVIEPSIVDLKKVNTAERIFAGAMAGSSAMLLKVKFSDDSARTVLSEPVFYAKANAIGGAWTFGATDNLMLTRVVNQACDYSRIHY